MDKMSFTDGIIQVIIQAAPTLVILLVLFIILSWVRLLVDSMSGRGL